MIGLLWYDADKKRSTEEKIAQAADRYRAKFGRLPNVCYLNPANGEPGTVALDGTAIKVLTATNILLHHYWVGESDDPGPNRCKRDAENPVENPIGKGG